MASVHEIPPNIQSIDELRLAINDRLRRLAGGGSLQITGDLDMQGHRLLNVGAPGGLNDGATLADVRRARGGGVRETVREVVTGGGGGSVAASVFVRRPAQLTANLNVTESEPATDSKLLVVFIKQGAATAYTVTFDAGDFAATPVNISPELGTMSAYMFVGNTATGKWELSTNPFTEVTL